MARRKIKIDLDELERLCVMQCTDEEIASCLRVTKTVLLQARVGLIW